jgi:diguanylate cyclase (GGDEF)-like protein
MDAYTLHIATAFTSLLMTVSMLGLYVASPREHCLFDWAVAGMLFLAASVMSVLVFHYSLPFLIAPVLLNVCYLTGHAVILVGVRRYLGLSPHWKLVPILAFLVACLHLLPWIQALVVNRILVFFPIIMVINGLTVAILWRKVPGHLRLACMPLMLLELLFIAQMLLRTLIVVAQPNTPLTYAGSQYVQTSGTLAIFVFLSLGTMACALMVFRRQELALRQLTTKDPLTGWLNRRALQNIASLEFERSIRTDSSLIVLMLDIDYFKQVNDTYGHVCGDEALKHVTRLSAEVMRGYDYLFRYGGEEFIVLLPDVEDIEVKNLANRVRLKIQSCPLKFEAEEVSITVSIGLTALQRHDADWRQLLKRADAALYYAKEAGRNRVGYHNGANLAIIE